MCSFTPPGDLSDLVGHFVAGNALNVATLDFFDALVDLSFPGGLDNLESWRGDRH
jgi:hypothetical protein